MASHYFSHGLSDPLHHWLSGTLGRLPQVFHRAPEHAAEGSEHTGEVAGEFRENWNLQIGNERKARDRVPGLLTFFTPTFGPLGVKYRSALRSGPSSGSS
jgi:hypothetical protein